MFLQKEGKSEYSLLFLVPEKFREITIPFAGLPDKLFSAAKAVCRSHKSRACICAAAGAVLGLLLCLLLYREPAGYLVPRSYTDGQIALEEAVYLESADDADWSGYRILNYKDAETPMQIISGKAIQLETARYYLGSVLIGERLERLPRSGGI